MSGQRVDVSKCGLTLLIAGCLAVGCAPIRGAPSHIKRLAERDLSCPPEQLSYAKPAADTYDARGCNRQVRYVRACRAGECVWRQDALPQTLPASPQ
jgi:hypothetical protein